MSNLASLTALLNGDFPNALIAATPGGIEQQEAAGQAKLAKSADRLPLDINYPRGTTHAQITAATGIQFGQPVDKIFIEATLPDGWKIVPTSHAMWSDLVDDKGQRRAGIFFKAAFYDYNAHIGFECRYVINSYSEREDGGIKLRGCQVVDKSNNKVLWSSEYVGERDYDAQDKNSTEARKWLQENFPQHNDPFAYWND